MVGARFGLRSLLLNHHGRTANGNRERGIEEETNMIKEGRRLDKKRRPEFSGIIVDGGGARWLDDGDVESDKWRRHLVAIHVCEDSGIVLFSTAACRATVRLNVHDHVFE